ncbi:MAG: PAS domain S-box protein [Desulfobacterales bacterium]
MDQMPGAILVNPVVFMGIWAEAVREHATLFINDYSKPDLRKKGLPDGHLAVERFMAVPIFEGGRIVAIAGVGNKASDYEKSDERQIVLLLTGMWGYVQRNRSREELRQAYNELEEKVKQRTAELAASTTALQESHKDLNRAQEVGQIGSWRVDVRHNVLNWSDETHRIFGVPKGTSLTYEIFQKIVHPEDRQMVERRWKVALCGEPYDLEHRIVVGGQVKWVREKAYLEFDDEGKLQGGFGITQDITERKLAEEQLRESEAFLNKVLDSSVAGLYIYDLNRGANVFVNRQYMALTGYSLDGFNAMDGAEFAALFHPEDLERVTQHMQAIARAVEGDIHQIEYRFRTVQGDWIWCLSYDSVFARNADGSVSQFIGTFVDITDSKLAEEALRKSEARHRLLAETMLQGVVHQSADGTIIAMNPAAERILGKTQAEFLGSSSVKEEHHTIREDGSPFPGLEHPAMVALQSGQPVHGVVMGLFHPGRNERRWIRIDAVPIFRPGEPQPVEVYTVFEDITDRKKAEEAIKKSEQKYRTLFDSMSDGFALGKTIFDEKGKPVDHVFLEVNDAFEKQTGIKKEFILNKPVTKAIPGIEKDPADWIGVYGKVAKTGKPVQFENYAQHEGKWYSLYVYSPMKDHFAVMFSDITERKNHQERINNLNLLLDTITSSTKFIIATIDRNFRFTYFNKEHKENIKRITGKDNKIGMSIPELFSEMPDQQKIALELWKRVLKGKTVEKAVEFGPKHYKRYYRTRYVPIFDKKGKVVGAGEVSNDITEIKKTEEALRQSEEKYRSIVETATEAILIVDPEARIVFVNDRWSEMLGYSREEAMHMTHFELVFPEDLLWMRERWKFRQGGRKQSYEFRLRRKDGSPVWVLVGVAPRFGSAGEFLGTLTMLADITERKLAEEALRELNATLESKVAQRTEELVRRASQLQRLTLELAEAEERERKRLAEILHDDLQQVLVAANFHVELLRMRVMDDAESCEAAGEVRNLLTDAIDKSRSLSHELSSPALSQGDLGGALEWLARQMQQKHLFTVHLEIAGKIEVASEPRRFLLYKAAQEMLLNVIKHAGVREARLRLRRQRGRIWLTLSDRGRGFDPAHLGHTPGFGLLSIRERVESLGGRLKIKSAPNKGSTFIITVPDEDGSPQTRP